MHILYLQQLLVLPGNPGTQRSWEMARHWQDAGHEVSILTTSALFDPSGYGLSESSYMRGEYEGIHLHILDIPYSHFMPFKQRMRAFYTFYRQAYKLAQNWTGIDVVLAYSAPLSTGFLGKKLAKKLRCPFVFEVADVWPDVPVGMGIVRHPILIHLLDWQTEKVYKAATTICTFTEDMKEQIQSHGVDAFKIQVVHNGAQLRPVRLRTDPPTDTVKVVYTGSLGRANGISQLLYAWKRIEKKWSNKVSCHILGEGTEEESLKTLARDLGLRSLFFHKPVAQQEIGEYLKTADIGLVCIAPFSILEANGATKAFDYMASGVPLVLNYEGWLATYLDKYTCGLYAPLGHIETFAQKINRLILDKEVRREMGINARKLVESQFERKMLADKMLAIFEEAVSFT